MNENDDSSSSSRRRCEESSTIIPTSITKLSSIAWLKFPPILNSSSDRDDDDEFLAAGVSDRASCAPHCQMSDSKSLTVSDSCGTVVPYMITHA
ncbi:hypothetical protein Tco_1051499 [Tanacetum coccineum]